MENNNTTENKKEKKRFVFEKQRYLNTLIILGISILIFIPITFFAAKTVFNQVHTIQGKLTSSVEDITINKGFDESSVTFGMVDEPELYVGYQIANIKCDRLNIDAPVFYGANRVCLRDGVSLVTTGGRFGYEKTTLITGYTKTYFASLPSAKVGDEFYVSSSWGQYTYTVTNIEILESDKSPDITDSSKERVVLFTTYPDTPFALYEGKRLYVYLDKTSGPAVEVNK